MPESQYRSYAVTISTKEHVEGDLQEYIVSFLKQYKSYGVIELDKSGKRHAHFQIWLEEAKPKSQVFRTFKKRVMNLSPESIQSHAIKIKIAYSDDYVNYMEKDIKETLSDSPPQGDTSPYYPSEEEQEKAMKKVNAKDAFFHLLSELWTEYNPEYIETENSQNEVCEFLYHMMFKEKRITVIVDDKRRKGTAKALYHYLFHHYNTSYMMTKDESDFIELKKQFKEKNI